MDEKPVEQLVRRERTGGAISWLALAVAAVLVAVLHLAPSLHFSPIASWLPSYQLQAARRDFIAEGASVGPSVSNAARTVASGAPLNAAPFYFRAIELEPSASDEEILSLLDEVLKRDPRHYPARLWRARIYYRSDRIAEAVDEVLKVIPLNRRSEADHIEALVDVARDPDNQPILLELIARQPSWAGAFVRRVNAEIDDENFRLALASQSSFALNQHIRDLIANGEHARAFHVWQSTLTHDQLLAFSWPVDARFAPGNQDAPFGWRTDRNTASRGPDGIYVSHTGRGARLLLSQTMLLGSGYRYRVALWLSGQIREDGGWLNWTMTCPDSKQVLGGVDVHSLDPQAMPLTFDVLVPDDGCGVQEIAMAGRPGEYAYPARVTVREVQIEGLGPAPEDADALLPEPDAGP